MAPRSTTFLGGLGLLIAQSAQAGPALGLNWTPAPQTDALQSGLAAGEFDGLIQPSLTPYIGWTQGTHQVLLQLNWVVFSSSTQQARTTLGNLRVGVDYRRYYPDLSASVKAFSSVGAYQLIPLLQDINPAYSDSEAALAESLLSEQRALLSGTGFRLGFGAEVEIRDRVFLGGTHHLVLHMNFQKLQDSLQTNALSKGVTGIHTTVHF